MNLVLLFWNINEITRTDRRRPPTIRVNDAIIKTRISTARMKVSIDEYNSINPDTKFL